MMPCSQLRPIGFIVRHENIVFRFIELVTGFCKPGVNRLIRRLRRIPHLPVPQHTGVISQNRKAQPLVFHELLCFCSDTLCVERRCAGRLVRAEMKICHQLPYCIIGRKLKQSAYKVDHISVFPAGKTIMIVRHITCSLSNTAPQGLLPSVDSPTETSESCG